MIGDINPLHKTGLSNNEIASCNKEKLAGILLDTKWNLILILHLFLKMQAKNLELLQE